MASLTTYQTGTDDAFSTVTYLGRGKVVAWPSVGVAEGAAAIDEQGTQQGNRHTKFRALASTSLTYNGDAMAAFGGTGTYNERLIAWLQSQTGSSMTEINGLMQLFAEQKGATNWSSLGSWS
jgi:hypothetical protein